MSDTPSRYALVSRRTVLRHGAGLGALALVPGLACGSSDGAILAGASTEALTQPSDAADATGTQLPTTAPITPPTADGDPAQPDAAQPDAAQPDAAEPPAAQPTAEIAPPEPTSTPATPAPTAVPTAVPTALAAGAQAVIDFSYTQAPGGKNVSPYIAVWIEDSASELVATVALWYQQTGRGERWLPDLKRWYSVDQSRISGGAESNVDVISSATRLPGSFRVMWDGRSDLGALAAAGDYFLCIESARERGPYSLIRQAVSFAGSPLALPLGDDGELTGASVTIDV